MAGPVLSGDVEAILSALKAREEADMISITEHLEQGMATMQQARLSIEGRLQLLRDAEEIWSAPDRPSAPPSPYQLFATERGPKLALEHPDLSLGDLGKALSKEWQQMDPADKAPFEIRAGVDRSQFAGEVAAQIPFVAPEVVELSDSDDEGDDKTRKRKRGAAGGEADKIPSAYQLYTNDVLPAVKAKHPAEKAAALTKRIRAMWKELSPDAKKSFTKARAALAAKAKQA